MINHYEIAYRDAREVLHHRDKNVGKPIYNPDGLRYCVVDGLLFSDREVFKEAWGTKLADELLREWSTSDSLNCFECNRLWHEYLDAARGYLQIFRQQNRALVEEWPASAKAAERRQGARQSLRDHTAIHRLRTVVGVNAIEAAQFDNSMMG
jgi:hypothetical protein